MYRRLLWRNAAWLINAWINYPISHWLCDGMVRSIFGWKYGMVPSFEVGSGREAWRYADGRGLPSRDGTGSRVSGSPGQQFGSGSGRVTGQSPDPAFWPGLLFNVVKNCRQSASFIISMRYRGHWHVSHKQVAETSVEMYASLENHRSDHCPAVAYLFTDPFN